MLKGKLQVTIKDGVLVKAVEIKTDDDSQSYIDYIVPDGVTKIGIRAFWNCVSLRNIIIPKHVAEIDLSAFYGCCNLESVTIPDTIIIRPYIASTSGNWLMFTFEKCHKLKDININISDLATYLTTDWEWRNIKTFGIYQTGWRGRHMLVNGEKITELVIPDGITRIGDNSLFGYEELTSIKLPEGVTTIGANAFNRCSNLKSIMIPNSVVSIGGGAFWNCHKLESIYFKHTLPPNAELIGIDPAKLHCNGETTLVEYFWNSTSKFPRIYVPKQSVELYKQAEGWSYYADNIVGYDIEDE